MTIHDANCIMNVGAKVGGKMHKQKVWWCKHLDEDHKCHFFPQDAIAWTFKLLQYWRCSKNMANNNHLLIFNKYNVHYLVFLPFPMLTLELEKIYIQNERLFNYDYVGQ
jgi:hypothetical protein